MNRGKLFPPIHNSRITINVLVSKLSTDELTVQACDVCDRLVLRTNSLAGTGVGTVTEAQLVHTCYHSLSALSSLWTSLWKECQLAYL